jgi:hypothetical protein
MSAKLAKLGALTGVTLGLVLSPFWNRIEVRRPSLLYAAAYFQAVLGNTQSALEIAQHAAKSESGASPAGDCPSPCRF